MARTCTRGNDELESLRAKARNHCHDAQYVGIDGEGATHFWSRYFQIVIVIDGDDVEPHPLDATPCEELGDWREHVEHKRGWDDCRIGGSILDELEALQ